MFIAVGRVLVRNQEPTQQVPKGRDKTMDRKYESPACKGYEALLEDSVSGEIGGSDAVRLSEHLKSCPGCREAREHVAPSSRLLRLAEASADPGPGFARDVMARIRSDRGVLIERGFWEPPGSLGL